MLDFWLTVLYRVSRLRGRMVWEYRIMIYVEGSVNSLFKAVLRNLHGEIKVTDECPRSGYPVSGPGFEEEEEEYQTEKLISRLKVSEEERGSTKQANLQYLCCHFLHSCHVCYLSHFSTEFSMFVMRVLVPCPDECVYRQHLSPLTLHLFHVKLWCWVFCLIGPLL
jgi:hypothetical protein